MGPKDKSKGKKPAKQVEPAVDASEHVTQLMKQFFEIQMADIEKKIARLEGEQAFLKELTEKIEQSIAECEREKGAIIQEMKRRLEEKENEKLMKRDQLQWLSEEVKRQLQRFEEAIAEKRRKFDEMTASFNEELANCEEELRVLEDFKANKTEYVGALEKAEEERLERERQHKRNLFAIRQKLEMAKVRLKKDLELRLLQLSIEFQQTSRTKIGSLIHRMLQENRAIDNELNSIKSSVLDYYNGYQLSQEGTKLIRAKERSTVEEKEKYMARCIIQLNIIKALESRNKELAKEVQEYLPLNTENEKLTKRLRYLENEIEKKKAEESSVKESLSAKKEEAARMNEVSAFVRRNTRRLQIVLRNAARAAEEAAAIQLIPMGDTEEERYMSAEAKLKFYQRRRYTAFKKKGKLLANLKDILTRAQLTEDEWKLVSFDSVQVEPFDFKRLFNPIPGEGYDEELEFGRRESAARSPGGSGSDVSLPRSLSVEDVTAIPRPGTLEEDEEEEEEEGEGEESPWEGSHASAAASAEQVPAPETGAPDAGDADTGAAGEKEQTEDT